MRISDLILLVLQGALVAAVPLALVWLARGGHERVPRLAAVTAFLTFDLIVFGAFTRLTDSGLGCPDWPGCFARANPLAAASDIAQAALANPGGPVDAFKAWIEMIHRTLAGGLSVLIAALVIVCWLRRRRQAWLAALVVGVVLVQIVFGALTVTLKLTPIVVTVHLMLGMLLLALLTWLAARLDAWPAPAARDMPAQALRPIAALGLGLVAVQIALGGWTSTNYAVVACTDFPLCHGQIVPQMDFAQGFHLFHALGRDAAGGFLSGPALTAIHWTHRNFGVLLGTYLLALAAALLRSRSLVREAKMLAAIIVLQIATGLANILLGWPLLAAILHNAGAAALVAMLVLINYRLHLLPRQVRAATPLAPAF